MINTATPTAAAEEPQVADNPAGKKSPAIKPRAAKKSPATKKKTVAKDDLLFKELSIKIIPGIIQKSDSCFRKTIFLF